MSVLIRGPVRSHVRSGSLHKCLEPSNKTIIFFTKSIIFLRPFWKTRKNWIELKNLYAFARKKFLKMHDLHDQFLEIFLPRFWFQKRILLQILSLSNSNLLGFLQHNRLTQIIFARAHCARENLANIFLFCAFRASIFEKRASTFERFVQGVAWKKTYVGAWQY